MFKCPVCHDLHRINDQYDNQDYDCPATHLYANKRKTFQNMKPTDLMTRPGYNMNMTSTKIDEHRDATIIPKLVKSDLNKFNKGKVQRLYNW